MLLYPEETGSLTLNATKILTRQTLLVVVLAGFALSATLILHSILKSPTRGSLAPQVAPIHKPAEIYTGLPVHLEIPKINVNAAIDYVGITPKGELGVPAGPSNAAWYDQGPRPGEAGNAVIDGHFGYRDNIPAVFDNLHTLQKGDRLYVKDERGITTTFVVRQLQTYDSNEYAPAVFRSNDGRAHLNLITCEGTWNETKNSFSSRLVVFTDKTT